MVVTEEGGARPFFASGEPTLASRRGAGLRGGRAEGMGLGYERGRLHISWPVARAAGPWKVTEVTEDAARELVMIRVSGRSGGRRRVRSAKRRARSTTTWPSGRGGDEGVLQYTTDLRCAVPRCQCPEHGVKTIGVPWAEPGSHFTLLFERAAVEALLACHTVKQAEEWLKLDWDSCQRIMERAVDRGLARRQLDRLRYVGLDEKSFLRGQRYISIMTDLGGRRVLEVVRGNDEESGRRALAEPARRAARQGGGRGDGHVGRLHGGDHGRGAASARSSTTSFMSASSSTTPSTRPAGPDPPGSATKATTRSRAPVTCG